jgi:hypothetical protein
MSRNAHFMVGALHHDPHLAAGAARYSQMHGVQASAAPEHYGSVIAHPAMLARYAQQYGELPEHDPAAVPHFEAMRQETNRQFDFMTAGRRGGGLGIHVETTQHDPYSNAEEMATDLSQNRRLKVLSTATTGSHPYFSDEENDKFRAVHDAFGHAGTGRGFDRHGEEAAYQAHARMFTPIARRALAAETRGQNSAMISAGGTFQPQKIATMPEASTRLYTPVVGRRTAMAQQGAVAAHALQFPRLNPQQFGGSDLGQLA